jgi:hypothetical protein
MRKRLVICLLVDLVLAIGVASVGHIDRRDEVRAFVAWRRAGTAESRAEFERQRRITTLQQVGFASVCFGALAAVTVPMVVRAARKRGRLTPQAI